MKTKVCLVDDEKDFVEALAQRLEVRDFDVTVALDGEQALEIVSNQDVDVVVLDVVMPGKDGIEVLREIKQINPLVEVIMLTGHATVDVAIEGMKVGAHDFLMKPTDTTDLIAKITTAHQKKAGHEERIRQAEIQNIIERKGW